METLPNEILLHIFSFLDTNEYPFIKQTCKIFNNVLRDPSNPKTRTNIYEILINQSRVNWFKEKFNKNPDEEKFIFGMIKINNIEMVRHLLDIYMGKPFNNIQKLKESDKLIFKYPSRIVNHAARYGVLECLQCIHEEYRIPFTMRCTGGNAASGNHIDCLKYIHENVNGWDVRVCHDAAKNGHIECLRYAHENGCEMRLMYKESLGAGSELGDMICRDAAGGGYIDCLMYAHENGCGWSWETIRSSLCAGKFECFKYAYENGCPVENKNVLMWNMLVPHKEIVGWALKGQNTDCIKYVFDRGYRSN